MILSPNGPVAIAAHRRLPYAGVAAQAVGYRAVTIEKDRGDWDGCVRRLDGPGDAAVGGMSEADPDGPVVAGGGDRGAKSLPPDQCSCENP